jgi:hypothetical protein
MLRPDSRYVKRLQDSGHALRARGGRLVFVPLPSAVLDRHFACRAHFRRPQNCRVAWWHLQVVAVPPGQLRCCLRRSRRLLSPRVPFRRRFITGERKPPRELLRDYSVRSMRSDCSKYSRLRPAPSSRTFGARHRQVHHREHTPTLAPTARSGYTGSVAILIYRGRQLLAGDSALSCFLVACRVRTLALAQRARGRR